MSENNGAVLKSRAQAVAQLGRELAAQIAELEALAAWAAAHEERQARLEILAAACEEEKDLMATGAIWLS